MIEWVDRCAELLHAGEPVVIVSIAAVQGSSPREAGARMLVTRERVLLTIGGGNLEFQTIAIARQMLQQAETTQLQRFSLAAGLGQCCGGVVNILFEKLLAPTPWLAALQEMLTSGAGVMQVIPLQTDSSLPRMLVSAGDVHAPVMCPAGSDVIALARSLLKQSGACTVKKITLKDGSSESLLFERVGGHDFNILLFGAGHVGQALASLLAQQPCQLRWVDTREGQLPAQTAANMTAICTDVPAVIIDEAAPGSYFLVMTHDHQLDLQLARQILERDDFRYFGLIGSRSKRMRFEHRLRAHGIRHDVLQKMVCPIGIPGIKSKLPSAIAVSVMAELLQVHEGRVQCSATAETYRQVYGRS